MDREEASGKGLGGGGGDGRGRGGVSGGKPLWVVVVWQPPGTASSLHVSDWLKKGG